MPRSRTGLVAAVLVLLAAPLSAQIPERFTNLQVLPKDIPRAELVQTMRGWASALGFRCHNCHEGPEDLTGMDFASDAKATKRAAREMARMVKAINTTVSALPARDAPREAVSCYNCHRRQARPPLPLHEELLRAVQAGGVPAAAARYRELRRAHENDGAYDLTAMAVGAAVLRLAEGGRLDEALALAEFGVEQNPQAADAHGILGEVRLRRGDRAGAAESFKQALQRDPQHAVSQRRLKDLERPPSPSPPPK
jgi:tetratricopeptide (TPR) repeat protein